MIQPSPKLLFCWSTLMMFGSLLLQGSHVANAAHSRTRFVVRQNKEPEYDRSISTFSAEGRLLQVEYGMEASLRGSSVAAVHLQDNNTIFLLVQTLEKVYRLDEHVWLVAAGLAGDARYIANGLRNVCQQLRMTYGEPPSIEQVAKQSAEMQHLLSRAGGARPLGCTAIILGIDPSPPGVLGQPRIFRTDPGGVMEEYDYCTAGNGQTQVMMAVTEQLQSTKDKDKEGRLAKLAKAILDNWDMKNEETVDILTIEPHLHRRGKMKATGYVHVNKQNLGKIDFR